MSSHQPHTTGNTRISATSNRATCIPINTRYYVNRNKSKLMMERSVGDPDFERFRHSVNQSRYRYYNIGMLKKAVRVYLWNRNSTVTFCTGT